MFGPSAAGVFSGFSPRVLWHKTADRACCLVRHVPSGSNVCWAWSWWADLSAACAFGQLRLLGLELEGRLGLQHVPLCSRYLSSQSAVRFFFYFFGSHPCYKCNTNDRCAKVKHADEDKMPTRAAIKPRGVVHQTETVFSSALMCQGATGLGQVMRQADNRNAVNPRRC